jgi:flavodoxin
MKIVIAFCSPAGSTRHVAQAIHNRFNQQNVEAVMLDLAKDHNRSAALDVIKTVYRLSRLPGCGHSPGDELY